VTDSHHLRWGLVTGLTFEARILLQALRHQPLSRPPLGPVCAYGSDGTTAARAAGFAASLVAQGAEALLSFGLCGGLAPELQPGDLLLPEEIVGPEGEALACHGETRAGALAAAAAVGRAVRGGRLASETAAVVSAEAKRRLHAQTQALGVDMESYAVARTARQAGLPFMALRAVADSAERGLPAAALAAVKEGGHLRPDILLAGLARRPRELAPLIRLAGDTRRAMTALRALAPELLRRLA
jgi:adenosylhomocysteine nucleosidase